MPTLETSQIAELIFPYCGSATQLQLQQLSDYLDLLLKWNSKTNLTAVRRPEDIVTRHFGESLFMATHLPPCHTLLDFGSGAGFPGLPTQIFLPTLVITLAESQNKKAAFLREAVRHLGLSTEIWADRVENMPPQRKFNVVALRAVDNPSNATRLAHLRVSTGGTVALLTAEPREGTGCLPLPGSEHRFLQLL